MSENTQITLSKGGIRERTVKLHELTIPDLWEIAEAVRHSNGDYDSTHVSKQILKCWYIAHDLKKHIANQPD